jgi:hypothetical protein
MDVAGLNVSELQAFVERKQFFGAKNVRPYIELVSDARTGFSVGASPLYLVVYDKLQEQDRKYDSLYFEALIQRRCGGIVPAHLARLEYQVSRTRFRDFGINSVPDLFRLRGSLAEKLTTDWFRLTTESVDRKNNHQSRAKLLPLWVSLGKAFCSIFGRPRGPLVPLKREKVNPFKLLRISRGSGASALLQKGLTFKTYHDFIFALMEGFYAISPSEEEQIKFLESYHWRLTEYAA